MIYYRYTEQAVDTEKNMYLLPVFLSIKRSLNCEKIAVIFKGHLLEYDVFNKQREQRETTITETRIANAGTNIILA